MKMSSIAASSKETVRTRIISSDAMNCMFNSLTSFKPFSQESLRAAKRNGALKRCRKKKLTPTFFVFSRRFITI